MTTVDYAALRDRLIHILVVHFDMFRPRAEDIADLFLHHKTLERRSTDMESERPAPTAQVGGVVVKALEDAERWNEEEGDPADTLHHGRTLLERIRSTLSAIPTETGKGEDAAAIEIADAVLTWMVKRELLDADLEYRDDDVIEVLNDLIDIDAIPVAWQWRMRVRSDSRAWFGEWSEWRGGHANVSAMANDYAEYEERPLYARPVPAVTDEMVEAAARALVIAKGTNPDALFQINVFTGQEPFDHKDASGKRFIYSWRKQVDNARAALTAALSLGGSKE